MYIFQSTNGKVLLGVGVLAGVAAITGTLLYKRKCNAKITRITLGSIDEFQKSTVHIKDRKRVEEIINAMIEGGRDKLQVIADFDRTLSRYKHNGKLVATCHNSLDNSGILPDFYRDAAKKLLNTYYPIEIDHKLTSAEKYPYMVEWWTKAHELLIQCNLTEQKVEQLVKEANIMLREGSDRLLSEAHKHSIPFLIFSAGLGDIIELVLKQQAKMYDNIKVVSNYMDFNHQGVLVGFKGELIHIYNKNESAIHKSDYFEKLSTRKNVILLGDSMGDLTMAEGAKAEHILKIGFLNDKIEERMSQYLDVYDVVLVSDESVDLANALLKLIVR